MGLTSLGSLGAGFLRAVSTIALSGLITVFLMSGAGIAKQQSAAKGRSGYERGLKAAGIEPYSRAPSETKPYAVCPPPTEVRVTCLSAVVPDALAAHRKSSLSGPRLQGSGERGGYSPADLRSAYNLPIKGGSGLTIAITIAYDYPTAESDLAVYRKTYGLPPCTTESGCFKKVNQQGKTGTYPPANSGWAAEAALDLDMASAICPECKLLLVEANDNSYKNMPLAVKTAAGLGADVISNSWGSEEFPEQTAFDPDLSHPGIPVLFASGDSGYGAEYPASSPHVIAVGGTSLYKDESARGWRESAWAGAGSGCSAYEKKPPWQSDTGCTRRTVADVAAVADPNTPVSVYDSYGGYKGWLLFGGTSASAPILAGVEALSSATERAKGAELFWEKDTAGKLFDIGEGRNGGCPPAADYLCVTKLGYDGPTGWGTPGGSRPGPPLVGAYDPSNIGAQEAMLNGAVNPNGKETTYRFEYDTVPYEGKAPHGIAVPVPDASIGSGTEGVEVAQHLTGLTSGVTYHFRLVASNSLGTTYGGDRTFIPSRWSAQYMPREEQREEMFGVSCSSSSSCVAVGSQGVYFAPPSAFYNDAPLVERWDGKEWVREAVPVYHPPAEGYASSLGDVSCSSEDACMAVGVNYEIGVGYGPLVERWDGKKWSLVPVPLPKDAALNQNGTYAVRLHGVSCTSASSCVLVGEFTKSWNSLSPNEIGTLVARWDGSSWTVQPSPNPPGGRQNLLWGVSCLSATSCVAVGESRDSSNVESVLIERWDGAKWSIDPGPILSGGLQDVSCSSQDECIAVGGSEGQFGGDGRAEIWNGSKWTVSPIGRPMRGVSCPRADLCVAVGGDLSAHQAYAEIWNGVEWTAENPILPADASDDPMEMYDVSCASTGCTAVGWYWSWGYQPLAERLNGLLAPDPPSVGNDAVGVVKQTTAVLRAHVDNNGAAAGSSCYFEVAPKLDASNPIAEPACEPNPVGGDASTLVSATATGLIPDTEYVYRVVAENESGVSRGTPDEEFRTLADSPNEYPLAIVKVGAGEGAVISSPGGLDCGGTCVAEFEEGAEVELSPSAGPGSEFREWGGACSGADACRVTMSEAREVTAFFANAKQLLTVKKTGLGAGWVKARPAAVSCVANCSQAEAKLYKGVVVTLTASPATGSAFAGWSGCDSEPEGKCVVAMNSARSVTAAFSGIAKAIPNSQVLALAKAGTGQGTVKSKPGGIVCEANCAQALAAFAGAVTGPPARPAAVVVLSPTAAPGSQFTEWINCPLVEGSICRATMSSAKSIAARFEALPNDKLLTVDKAGSGAGSVRSRPFAVNCVANCSQAEAKLYKGVVVTLTASPATGSAFAGWSGCDSEPEGKCVVAMNSARSVTAAFSGSGLAIPNSQVLTLAKEGTGRGTVTSKPGGIACAGRCTQVKARFSGEVVGPPARPARTVVLYATPALGSQLTEWVNCPLVEGNICRVTMDSAKSVAARFDE